jgi:hypothetical protein
VGASVTRDVGAKKEWLELTLRPAVYREKTWIFNWPYFYTHISQDWTWILMFFAGRRMSSEFFVTKNTLKTSIYTRDRAHASHFAQPIPRVKSRFFSFFWQKTVGILPKEVFLKGRICQLTFLP